ncbi:MULTISPECIES: Gfo/Idh/MocA family oxidoreductase [unclassified Sphingomonas]|uniref:Gfo/Idh/MocA family protein n=1 Tax=unclassified Sphingomonas TaxID=196159 RepID=UPI002269F2D0|nr:MULTISPECIES: Gfo/Idh/MocA family oxidoreductase [unclassified Sphingomonas]
MAIKIGIVGIGKIARDQHIPVLDASPDFELFTAASHNSKLDRGTTYGSIEEMIAAEPSLEAIALCQPPQVRFDAARLALQSGKHVFLEKPPGATLSEIRLLRDIADAHGVTLFASWHSRYASGVEPARQWLAGKTLKSVAIEWKEDVRHWHPGQAWIWQPGGMGVFDPGINALSIATHILPPFFLTEGSIEVPANRAAPIAADLRFTDAAGTPIVAAFDWRQTGPQTWDIRVDTDAGQLTLSKGGSEMYLDGVQQSLPPEAEYRGLYDRFADLVKRGVSDVDVAPMRHVADAYLRAERLQVEAFED